MITVGIPAHNAGGLLLETLHSLVSQTFDRIVIHVHDDGSTDDTAAVAQTIDDPRIMVTRDRNRGVSEAANVVTRFVSTPLFARADADDVHLPHRLAAQLAYLDSQRLDVMSSQLIDIDAPDVPERVGAEMDPDRVNVELLFYNPLPNPLAFGHSEVFRATPYSTAPLYGEDYDFWCRTASAGWRIGLMAQPLARYRRHAAAASSRLADIADQEMRVIRRRYHHAAFPGDEAAEFRNWLAWIVELQEPMSADQTAASLGWAFGGFESVRSVNLSRPLVEAKLRWLVERRFVDRPSATHLRESISIMRKLGWRASLLGFKRSWSRKDFWV